MRGLDEYQGFKYICADEAEKYIVEKLQKDGINIVKPSDLDEKSLREIFNRVSSILNIETKTCQKSNDKDDDRSK